MGKTSARKLAVVSDNTEAKQSNLIPFKPGQSGNPNGRPAGSRNKLGEAFVNALLEDWGRHGTEAIIRMREADPAAYVRVVASMLPKHVALDPSPLDGLTDEQLSRLIAVLLEARGDD